MAVILNKLKIMLQRSLQKLFSYSLTLIYRYRSFEFIYFLFYHNAIWIYKIEVFLLIFFLDLFIFDSKGDLNDNVFFRWNWLWDPKYSI